MNTKSTVKMADARSIIMDNDYEKAESEVFAWGSDKYGQLGLGSKAMSRCYCIPRTRTFDFSIKKIACGRSHTAILTTLGQIYTMGSNSSGQLGIDSYSTKSSPTPLLVESLSKFYCSDISCGYLHTACIIEGEVYTWGEGRHGALGTGNLECQLLPSRINFGKERIYAVKVVCGPTNTAVIDNKGRLYTFGDNKEKTPTLFPLKHMAKDVACGADDMLILLEDGSIISTASKTGEIFIKGIVKIAAGGFSAALSDQGIVYIWDHKDTMPAAVTGLKAKVREIAIGGNFAAAIDENGTVYTWGSNFNGELGQGDYEPKETPCAILSLKGKNVRQICCGESHVVAIADGKRSSFTKINTSRGSETSRPRSITQTKKGGNRTARGSPYKDDTLGEVYRREAEKRSLVEKEIEAMLKQNNTITERIRAIEIKERIKEQGFNMKYKEKLDSAEKQFRNQKEKTAGLEAQVHVEKEKSIRLENEASELSRKIEDLQRRKIQLKQKKDQQAYESGLAYNTKLAKLLTEYEGKIEHEIEEKHKLMKTKASEINELYETIREAENALASLQQNTQKTIEKYKEEIQQVSTKVEDEKKLMCERETIGKKIRETKETSDQELSKAQHLEKTLTEEIWEHNNEVKAMIEDSAELENIIEEASQKIEEMSSIYKQIEAKFEEKEHEFSEYFTIAKGKDEKNLIEIEKLTKTFNEADERNKYLRAGLSLKISEIEALNNEVSSWKNETENTNNENTRLKKAIENLEERNKRLLEQLNANLYNKAAEYKQRALKMLKTSVKSSQDSTKAGIARIVQMTKFQADTVQNVKENLGPKQELFETTEPGFNGRFVLEKKDYNVQEGCAHVKSNSALISLMDSCMPTAQPPPAHNVEAPEPSNIHQEIVKSARKLLATLGSRIVLHNPYTTPAKCTTNKAGHTTPSTGIYGLAKGSE
eukprot:TRINITY_DN1861_c0_g1_i1.p2 TRINITY_DN1861_c0_g1~~TRINITY_DN1861_c0_g1_i1.p2  ORF type:complete len:938 (+),score=121.27 TRINITY_DN1861_c0_g1_i1:12015-14828(+)